ncbi:MAG TPA: S1C family serine protease [Terriglobales bacterium]|nr:S1C family serine protease [Terriglobales bacterium]
MASVIASFSQELAAAAEQAGSSVVAIHARHRVPSSGIYWRKGVLVTANHAVRREDDITVLVHGGKRVSAKLAGRDAGTDLAILKFDQDAGVAIPQFGDAANLKLANFVLALGRTRFGNLVASAGIIGGLGGEWRTWRGGRIEQSIRLDLALYPGFSGGPLVNGEGKVLGLNTNGFGRGRAVTIPVATVNRVVDELLDKGHIARPYLGIAMQPVAVPEALRSKLKSSAAGGLMVLHVEPDGPADKAGIVLGDVIVELQGKPALDTEYIQDLLASAKVNEKIRTTVIRGGSPLELSITLGERPAK